MQGRYDNLNRILQLDPRTQNQEIVQLVGLERLSLRLERGDVLLTLPSYQPRSPGVLDTPGDLSVLDGDLRIVVPADVGGRFEIPQNSTPTYDEALYRIEVASTSWLMLARNYDTATIRANYRLTVPRGTTVLDVQ